MPLPLDARGIMFLGCPSVRPSVPLVCQAWNNLSTCTWVHWSIQLWPFFRPVHLSVQIRFQGIIWRTHVRNDLQFCMVMYPEDLQNWWDYTNGLLIFLIVALFWLGEMGQICGFWALPGERLKFCMLMYPEHLQNWLDFGHGLLIFLLLFTFT